MLKKIIILILLNISLFGNIQNADDIGFVDDITINGREFESLEQRTIEFYSEDLQNGKVVIQGLLESLDKNVDARDLFIEITNDGGKSWNKVSGHQDWEYSFHPVVGFTYEFSLRIMRKSSTINNDIELPSAFNIDGFILTLSDNYERIGDTLKGNGTLYVPWLETFGLNGNIAVSFDGIGFTEDRITSGSIRYLSDIVINYEGVKLDISKLVFNVSGIKNSLVSKLSSTSNVLLSSLPNTEISSLSFDTKGITGTIEYSNSFNFDIWQEQDVKVAFSSLSLDFSLLTTTGLNLSISDLIASLNFGNLLGSAQKNLAIKKDEFDNKLNGVFQWSEISRQKLINDSTVYISNSIGTLNLQDLSNPKIIFDTSIDLSQYGAIFESINAIEAKNIEISKSGLNSSFSTTLNPISIWDEQNVKLNFDGKIGVDLKLIASGLDINIKTGSMNVNFGNLFDSATAELKPIINNTSETISSKFTWALVETKKLKDNVDIQLDQLSGELDLSNLIKPEIIFNANADLSAYGGLLTSVKSASISDATISKDGLSASLGILIDSLDIWKSKGVKLKFAEESIPSLSLSLSSSGDFNFGFSSLDAVIDFGTLFPYSVATLETLQNGLMNLSFDPTKTIYLLNEKNILENFAANLDLSQLDNPKISFSSKLKLSGYSGVLSQIKELDLSNASISKNGFSATATASLNDINIWKEKKVKLKFAKVPNFSLSVKDKIDFSLNNLDASLDFGDIFNGEVVNLDSLKDDANNIIANSYSWGVSGGKKITSTATTVLDNLKGILDLANLDNPIIIFNADVNLSAYGGALATINNAKISNAKISKKGLSAETSLDINSINIYEDKNVKLNFNANPTLKMSLTTSGYKVGLSNLDASIDFGSLLQDATATISKVVNNSDVQDAITTAEDVNNEGQSFIENDYTYTWEVTGSHNLYGNEISLDTLMGTISFANLSNPSISLNANIVFNKSSFFHSYAQNVELISATISRNGFSSQIQTQLNDIPIWNEKNVKLDFEETDIQKLSISVLSSGFKISLDEFNANIDFGTLIKNARAEISTLSSGVFSWNLGEIDNTLLDSTIKLKNLLGSVDLTDITSPIIKLDGKINLAAYSPWFKSIGDISLVNAEISKSSFKTELSAELGDISIYSEKRVKLIFNDNVIPTFNFEVNRNGIDFGVKDIAASLDFGDLLSGEILTLKNKASSAVGFVNNKLTEVSNIGMRGKRTAQDFSKSISKKVNSAAKKLGELKGIYTWDLAGQHTFLSNGSDSILVSGIGGEVNLKNLTDPIIDFHAMADFSNYNLEGFNFDAEVKVEKAKISKSGIDWNLSISNGSTDFTVLDLGAKEEDVRVELFNINASTGSSGTELNSAAGTLFLGNQLFEGNVAPITLAYDGSKYTFKSTQTLKYSYENTSLEIINPEGSISKVNGSYKVSFTGNAKFLTDILKNIGVSDVSLSGLKISSEGLKANLLTTFTIAQTHTLFGDKVSLSLRSIGISIDSSTNIPIKLSSIDGDVDLSVLFNEGKNYAKTAIAFTDSKLTWNFGEKILHLGTDDKFEFKGLSGALSLNSLNSLSMNFSGTFGYKELEDINLVLKTFAISSEGISGSIGLGDQTKISTGIDNLDINLLSINFVNVATVTGNIGMHYSKSKFLGSTNDLIFDMKAGVSLDGVETFSLTSNSLKGMTFDNFATMSITGITSNLDIDDFSISLNGAIQPTHALLTSLNSVNYSGLEISKNGISIDSLSSTINVTGANCDLAGMSLALETLELGYKKKNEKDLLFFKASGELGLVIAKAGAGITVYSDGTYNINDIELNVNKPAIVLSGKFSWFDDSTNGKGFGLDGLNLGIGGAFFVDGDFKIGQLNSYRYWMAKASYSTNSGIPLSPIPLSLYGFGGGAAYGMTIERTEGVIASRYVANGSDDIIVSASVRMGTSDIGYTWHGDVGLEMDFGQGLMVLTGKSYILSEFSDSLDKKMKKYIGGTIVLGTSPFELLIEGTVNVKYLAGSFELIHLTGDGAIAYTSARKYIHLGTKADPISAKIFGGPSATAYLVIESDLFAIGSRFHSEKKYSSYGFGIGYDTTIGFDAEAGFGKKVYIDLQAYLKMAIEARIPIKGWFDLASVNGKVRFRTPDPTIFSLYLRGCAIKCASHTFYLIGSKSSAKEETNISILKEMEPYAKTDVSLQSTIILATNLPTDGTKTKIDNTDYTFNINNVKFVKTGNPSSSISLYAARISPNKVGYQVRPLLEANTEYKFTADVQWLSKNNVGTNVLNKVEKAEKIFTTTSQSQVPFTELIQTVTPKTGTENVSSDSKVRVYYSYLAKDLPSLNNKYAITVVNGKNESIEGTWSNSNWNSHKGRVGQSLSNTVSLPLRIFTPSKPFASYHFCLNNSNGEIRETVIRSDGKYYNPFKSYSVDGEEDEEEEESSNGMLSAQEVIASQHAVVTSAGYIARAAELGVSTNVFVDLNLGEPSVENDSFTYYSTNKYMIKVKDIASDKIVFISFFEAKGSGSQGEQHVYLKNNINSITSRIKVERGSAIKEGKASAYSQLLMGFELKAKANEFPICTADEPISQYFSNMVRTCDTCGNCQERLDSARQRYLEPSSNIQKITIYSGIDRSEYPNILPIVEVTFEDELNPEVVLEKQYRILYGQVNDNLYQMQFEGIEKIKNATVKYYVGEEGTLQRLINENRIEPVVTKEVNIEDIGLPDIPRPGSVSETEYEYETPTYNPPVGLQLGTQELLW